LAYVTSVDKGTSSMPPAIIPGTASPSPAIEEPASEGGRRKRRSKHQKRSYKSKTQKHR
jgi:hypothetical protein